MKPFDELTDAELAVLSQDEVRRYVDIECAEAGVPLIPERAPVAPNQGKVDLADMTVYVVGDIAFSELTAAEEVAQAINGKRRLKLEYLRYGGSYYEKKAMPATEAVTVTPLRVFSEDHAARAAQSISAQQDEAKRYQDDKAAYDKAVAATQKVQEPIFERIREATRREQRRQFLRAQHARYMELAEGRRRTAARFLESAAADARELCPELFEFTTGDQPDVPLGRARRYQNEVEEARETDDVAL